MPDLITARDRAEFVGDALDGLLDLLAAREDRATIEVRGLFALLYPVAQAAHETRDLLQH